MVLDTHDTGNPCIESRLGMFVSVGINFILFRYKNGVYMYSGGNYIGLHAVKFIGWRVENGQKYWLAANSWNANWGDHGFFKIVRGEGYLRIESYIIAGEPFLTAE